MVSYYQILNKKQKNGIQLVLDLASRDFGKIYNQHRDIANQKWKQNHHLYGKLKLELRRYKWYHVQSIYLMQLEQRMYQKGYDTNAKDSLNMWITVKEYTKTLETYHFDPKTIMKLLMLDLKSKDNL